MFKKIIKTASLIALVFFLAQGTAFALSFPLPAPGTNVVGQIQTVLSKPGDNFHSLAQKYDLGYYEMIEANPGLNPAKIPTGTLVILPTQYILPDAPREGIVLNIAELRLYYYPKNSDQVYTYPVGIGRQGWQTPIGTTTIITKTKHPTWYVPKSIRDWKAAQGGYLPASVPPGPDNPLGEYKMHLGWPAYMVHGTNDPSGVGMRSSSGCIRLYPWNIEQLFYQVNIGTRVHVVDEPYKVGLLDGHVYLESHVPLQESEKNPEDSNKSLINTINGAIAKRPAQINWSVADEVGAAQSGIPTVIGSLGTSTFGPS